MPTPKTNLRKTGKTMKAQNESKLSKGLSKELVQKIVIQQGDLTEMGTDAIVNAANNDLLLGGGVAGAIRRKGGDAIQRECNEIGSIPVGYAAITTGGKLAAKHVIHAASMQLGGSTTAEALRKSTAHALRIATDHGFKSIAFPAIGTGVAGFPMKECAEIMLHQVVEHLQNGTPLEKIYFVLFDLESCAAFESVWKGLRTSGSRTVAALAENS